MHIRNLNCKFSFFFRADEEVFGGLHSEGWKVLNDYPEDLPDVIPPVPMIPKRYRMCKKMLAAPKGAFYM